MLLGRRLGDVLLLRAVPPALVVAQLDVARIDQALDVRAGAVLVAVLGGADEVVVAEVHEREGVLEAPGVDGGPLHGGVALVLGGGDDLLGVLVGAGQEEDIAPHEPLGPGGHVGQQRGVAVPNVGAVVDVVDGGGDVVRGGVAGGRAVLGLVVGLGVGHGRS